MLLLAAGPDGPSNRFSVQQRVRDAMITGVAIVIPTLVTLIVLGFVVDFVSSTLDPVVGVVEGPLGLQSMPDYAVKGAAVAALVLGMFAIGLFAQQRPEEGRFEGTFDQMMARIPGVGSLYTSFNEMSELLLDSDTDSFQEVKLVEFPDEGSYTVAFLTADTPETVEEAAGHPEMETLFLPMAPNPVMGGYVIHVAEERVIDVDMSVQEGIRSIVTSGVAIEGEDDPTLSAEELEALSRDPEVERVAASEPAGTHDAADPEHEEEQARRERYDEAVDAEHADDPQDIARRERDDPDEQTAADGSPRTPSDLESLSDRRVPPRDRTEDERVADDESATE